MANREACELYIEQEIKSGLESGKKPYSIGKELSVWIEKMFEVHVKPNTLTRKAQRQVKKNSTNVLTKTESDSEDTIPGAQQQGSTNWQAINNRKDGEPSKKDRKRESTALGLAEVAIYQLSLIYDDDENRHEAFLKVKSWIKNHE